MITVSQADQTVFNFFVPVNPEPWEIGPIGAKKAGARLIGFVGRNAQLDNYQEAVKDSLASQLKAMSLVDQALFPMDYSPVKVEFYFWRRLDSYETLSGRKSKRHAADATNMQKALEDAIQGILIGNDRHNVDVRSRIVEQSHNVAPGSVIRIQYATPEIDLPIDVINRAVGTFMKADTFTFDNSI